VVILLGLTACEGPQSALDPQGRQATELANLFWIFLAILAATWVLTLSVLGWCLWRHRNSRTHSDARARILASRAIACAASMTVIVLLALTGLSFAGQKQLFADDAATELVTITGRQWWWEIRYQGREGESFVTANELHLPAGQNIKIKLASADVIHSFWVPSLFGKRDLVPGLENSVSLQASTAGILRGQCAEFCGLQHAHMGLIVVVESPADFARWRDQQRAAAYPVAGLDAQAGMAVFFAHSCNICHAIRGTSAAGQVGPDLTHLASRQWLGAATLPMSRAALARWIKDPQIVKPGVHMPAIALANAEFEHLLSYLEGLK